MLPITPLSRFLVTADHVCDYIPVISTISNVVNIFQICVLSTNHFSDKTKKNLKESYYFSYLIHEKELHRCFYFLIPGIGSIAKLILENKAFKLNQQSPDSLRNNKFVIQKKFKNGYPNFEFASEKLKDDEDFVFDLCSKDPNVLRFASNRLKTEQRFMERLLNQYPESSRQLVNLMIDDKNKFFGKSIEIIEKDKELLGFLIHDQNKAESEDMRLEVKKFLIKGKEFFQDDHTSVILFDNLHKNKNLFFQFLPSELMSKIHCYFKLIMLNEEIDSLVKYTSNLFKVNMFTSYIDNYNELGGRLRLKKQEKAFINNFQEVEDSILDIRFKIFKIVREEISNCRRYNNFASNENLHLEHFESYKETQSLIAKHPVFFNNLFKVLSISINHS